MNNRELTHCWANEKKESGKSGNIFFRDKVIYSYGTHFPIAKNLPGNIVLFTEKRYSNTTAKHISYVHRAIPADKKIITVWNVFDDGMEKENLTYMEGCIIDTLKKAYRARSGKPSYLTSAQNMLNNMQAYLDLRKNALHNDTRHFRNFIKNILAGLSSGEIQATISKQIAAERKAEKARQITLLREKAKTIEQWKNGESVYLPLLEYALLRIKNDQIETSQGAKVTIQEGKILWSRIKNNKPIIGHVISGYTVLSFNGELKIGCHKIARAEIDSIGVILDTL